MRLSNGIIKCLNTHYQNVIKTMTVNVSYLPKMFIPQIQSPEAASCDSTKSPPAPVRRIVSSYKFMWNMGLWRGLISGDLYGFINRNRR
jgi:hypothetical protein